MRFTIQEKVSVMRRVLNDAETEIQSCIHNEALCNIRRRERYDIRNNTIIRGIGKHQKIHEVLGSKITIN